MSVNLNSTFDSTQVSIALTVGNGITINGGGGYTVTPATSGADAGDLATYDQNTGTIANPQPGDILNFIFHTQTGVTNAPLGVVTYAFTEYDPSNPPSDISTFPASGGIGAEVVAVSSDYVLIDQAPSYTPGSTTISPDGQYFLISNNDISTFDGSFPADGSVTFPGAAVPEPSPLALMPIMVIALLVARFPAVRALLRTI
jgi:hypothetical protein